MSSHPIFHDQDAAEYERREAAEKELGHLKLVRGFGASETEEDEAARINTLCRSFSSQTSAASHVIAQVLEEPTPRALLDALIGATGGRAEFVEVTDEQLAAELGCSTRTIQTYRKQLRALPDYTILVDIKEHWRDPVTGTPHPHAYHVHVTRHAIEAEQNARLSAEWQSGDADAQLRALSTSAELVVRGASPKPPCKAKTRRKPSDAELMLSKVKQAATALRAARDLEPMVRNPDYDALREQYDAVKNELEAFAAEFGFAEPASTQELRTRSMEAEEQLSSAVPAPEHRVETDDDAPVPEKFSGGEKSAFYENQPPEPPSLPSDETVLYRDEFRAVYARKLAEGKSIETASQETETEVGEFEEWQARRVGTWDAMESRLKGGHTDASN